MAEQQLPPPASEPLITPLVEVMEKVFGYPSEVRQSTVIANILPSILVPANPNRFSYILFNNSDSDVWFGWSADVSDENGLLLTSKTGSFSSKLRDDGMLPIHEIYATSASDGRICTLVEVLFRRRSWTSI